MFFTFNKILVDFILTKNVLNILVLQLLHNTYAYKVYGNSIYLKNAEAWQVDGNFLEKQVLTLIFESLTDFD